MERFKVTTIDSPFFLGFDRILDDLNKLPESFYTPPGYPPHNVIRCDGDAYTVELALAGFREDQISVELKEDILTVSGTVDAERDEDNQKVEYLHRGLASRAFTKSFKLSQDIEVSGSTLVDGLLSIFLIHIIPEAKKVRKIEIGKFQDIGQMELVDEAQFDVGDLPAKPKAKSPKVKKTKEFI